MLGSLLFSKQTIDSGLLLSLFLLGFGIQVLAVGTIDGVHLVCVFLGYACAFALVGGYACGRVLCCLVQNGVDDAFQLVILRYLDTQLAGYLHEFGDRKLF